MKFLSVFSDLFRELKLMSRNEIKSVLAVMFTVTALLTSYPFIRGTSEAMLLQAFGAGKLPHSWLFSVLLLFIIIFILNKIQRKFSPQKVYAIIGFVTAMFFFLGQWMARFQNPNWAFPIFIWKEVYIVVMIHMAYGYLNHAVTYKRAKLVYGPLGACASLGGIVAGLITQELTKSLPVELIMVIGATFILISIATFWIGDHSIRITEKKNKEPLKSIKGVGKYVILIASLVAISQFIINIADFKFKMIFQEMFADKAAKASELAMLYTYVNIFTLFSQFIIIPWVLNNFKVKWVHYAVAGIYICLGVFSFGFMAGSLLALMNCFIFYKGIDYSIFHTAKEMLYFRLSDEQKYGAKYVVDMLTYRASKGVISSVLIVLIAFPTYIDYLFYLLLALWPFLIFLLFKEMKKQGVVHE